MYLMYIDESGDTIPLSQKGKQFLVLTGCIINDSDRVKVEEDLRVIKKKYFQNEDLEIKSNFLRYANPDLEQESPLKLHDREMYNQLEADIKAYLVSLPITLIAIVINKDAYWKQYPSQNPYEIAYLYLLERFQRFLKERNSLGLCVIDPRVGTVEKSFIGDSLKDIHHMMRWRDGDIWKKCPNIVEKLLYSTSEDTVGIQIADLYCYPVYHIFEYGKKPEEYWRYSDITYPKLLKVKGDCLGIGLKVFPLTLENIKENIKKEPPKETPF
ncbi:MAG: DUF3800 domain-containing protein [Candidatus Moraniibacteriota bacterium]